MAEGERVENKRIIINPHDSNALMVCQYCGYVKYWFNIRPESIGQEFTVQCHCGCCYRVFLDRREFYRKKVDLDGVVEWGDCVEEISIVDISPGGAKIKLHRTNGKALPAVGEVINLKFNLDDENSTLLERSATVRYVHENFIGCQFVVSNLIDEPIVAYLLNSI